MTRGLGTPAFGETAILKTLAWAHRFGRVLSAVVIALAISTAAASAQERVLDLYNIHTKETVSVTFKRNGRYVTAGLKSLDQFMRDWRLNIVTRIDPELYDLMWELKTDLGVTAPLKVISGHRSAKTNNMLRRTRGGQAKRSLHVRGSAVDVNFPGVSPKRLRNAALVKQRGGVGYYPRSGQPFVHIDTGRVRHWPRIPNSQLAAILKGGSPGLPVRQVRETAVAALDAPAPQGKPAEALTRQPAPFVLASATQDLITNRTRVKPVVVAEDEYRPRDWGESWLAPSRPKSKLVPRLKPTLVADAGPGQRLSTSLAPSNVVGYAAPAQNQNSASGRLLNGASTSLASMLANAERFSALSSLGAETQIDEGSAAVRPATSAKTQVAARQPPTRPLITPQQRPGGETTVRPIYTASLSPRSFLPPRDQNKGRFRAVLFAPAHALVFEPSPTIAQTLNLGIEGRNALAFSGSLFAATEVGAFAPVRNEAGYRVSSLRVVEAGRGGQNPLVAFARRAYDWLTGS